jgi:hypothetical protein
MANISSTSLQYEKKKIKIKPVAQAQSNLNFKWYLSGELA